MSDSGKKTVNFGFREVPEASKPELVQGVFSSVSGKYDLMNDAMSFGIHRYWKSAFVDWIGPRDHHRILDLAGGTGDIAFRVLRRAPGASATVLDLTEDMLTEGQKRSAQNRINGRIDWIVGDAQSMPFQDGEFDICAIGFGIRNFTAIPKALLEIYRVLAFGGRIMILEFSHVTVPNLSRLYDLYSFNIIPAIGESVANDRDSYRYLVESIRRFPKQKAFAELIGQAGFSNVKYRNLSYGIAAIHSGWKL